MYKIEKSPYTILKQCTKGDDSITEFLICIKVALATYYDSHFSIVTDLIRHHILEAVDPQARIKLYRYKSASLEELAQNADRLIAGLKQGHRSQPTPYSGKEPSSNQILINEVLESRLDSLQRSVSELSQSENHSIAKPPLATQVPSHGSQHHHNRPFNRNSSPQLRRRGQPRLCYCHSRFGNRARKCEGPPCLRGAASPPLSHLHNIFSPAIQSLNHSLFLITDNVSKARFPIDTGAAVSFFPLAWVDRYRPQPTTSHSFQAPGKGFLQLLAACTPQFTSVSRGCSTTISVSGVLRLAS